MRQKIRRFLKGTIVNQRFLCSLCIMTVITSLVTVMPVSAEEVQGTETESVEVLTESEEAAVTEDNVVTEPGQTGTEQTGAEQTDTEQIDTEQTGTEDVLADTVSGNDVIPQTTGTVSGNDVLPDAASNEAIALTSTEQTYTDEQDNIFTYELDEEGNATITGITVSGAALTIPVSIGEAPVIAVANANSCVVLNPEIAIPELTINCHTIGAKAFSGLRVGTLVIGEDVKALSIFNDEEYSFKYYYEQFAESQIDKVIFNAVELAVSYVTDDELDDFYGPFYEAHVGALEIGSSVTLIPEFLFHGAFMSLETLELQVENIGAYAFNSSNISIENLILGENVKTLKEASNSSPMFHWWNQFSSAKIGTLTFLANKMTLEHTHEADGSDSFQSPFQEAVIGNLVIGSNVTNIPEMFLYEAVITIEELAITQESVGAYAFSGSNISIGTLTLDSSLKSLEESYYTTDQFHYWEQFSDTQIGTLKLNAPELELTKRVEKLTSMVSTIYAPFHEANVGSVEIGTDVQRIPDYFLNDAVMSMEALEIHTPVIGAYAFASSKISFGTLTIGPEVTTFSESYYSHSIFHYWDQFQDCTIGHLIYAADAAEVINDVEAITGTSLEGPFDCATISKFTLADNVSYIPDYLLMNSKATIEELNLYMSAIGAMAFKGEKISIGKLIIGETVQVFKRSEASSSTHPYWEQFSEATIGEVYYNAPALELVNESEYDNYNQGPFHLSKIGKLYLSDGVERIPAYCFKDCYLEQEELHIKAKYIGTRAFASDDISIGTLTIGTEVETFESVVSGSLTYYRQFAECNVGTLVYLPVNLETGTECYKGIFSQTVIGDLVIDEAVEAIPNYLLYGAIMELEDFTLNVPVVGYFSFSSDDILFHKLTVGEDVKTFVANSKNYNRAFDESTIGQLDYMAPDAKMETLTQYAYGPFSYNTVIRGLTIGDNVTAIPYGCFRDADMNVEELTIENAAIGYGAFYGHDMIIGTLNIGKNVTYNGILSNQMDCFQWATIGTLNYNSSAVEPEWSTSTSSWGMFAYATISELNIGENVETIPAFWFRNAEMTLESLTIPCAWSYYSFYSSDIKIGTLTLNGDVAEISQINNYNLAFHGNTIDTVVYEIPAAVFNPAKANACGPFYNTTITNFILGEQVEYIDYRLLRENTITNCYVYPVRASEDYLAQVLTAGYLPTCTNLYIHYNSDFKSFFSNAVTEYHWLCVDYFDTTYGDKIIDEETGEYVVEIFKTCSVCGYEETDTEELDNSYDVYLSIPVEIPLAFDAEEKAYIGSEQIYAYGTLGNAYEGLQLVVERESELYGRAVMNESTYHISSYLSVGFVGGEAAVFSSDQLSENAAHVAAGDVDALILEQMNVTVDALAFVEGGAGNYQISIPIRLEFLY